MKLMMQVMELGGVKVLGPATKTDQEIFEKFRGTTWYKVDARKARNPGHHRKGFALLNLIFENQERYRTIEDLLVEVKLKAGWYTEHIRSDGAITYIPKSISFADMDQLEFEAFYSHLIDIAIQDYGLKEAVEFLARRQVANG